MKIQIAGLSHPGNVRETNDDHFSIGQAVSQKTSLHHSVDTGSSEFERHGLLLAVADGMGGYAGGEIASRAFLEALTKVFYANPLPRLSAPDAGDFLRICLDAACEAVVNRLNKKRELEEGGTTVAGLALFAPDIAVVFHCGDSRVLRVNGRFLRPLTVDHTLVGAEVASGQMTEEEAMLDPEMRALTRSIGVVGTNDPEINHELFWSMNDRFIICTDGLHGVGRSLNAHDIREAAMEDFDTASLTQRLVSMALGKGGQDNITAVVVQVGM
jgi:serine/threonine protein phosphatase PrpC